MGIAAFNMLVTHLIWSIKRYRYKKNEDPLNAQLTQEVGSAVPLLLSVFLLSMVISFSVNRWTYLSFFFCDQTHGKEYKNQNGKKHAGRTAIANRHKYKKKIYSNKLAMWYFRIGNGNSGRSIKCPLSDIRLFRNSLRASLLIPVNNVKGPLRSTFVIPCTGPPVRKL